MASNKLGNNGGRSYDFLNKPVKMDCSFVVDSSNGNGLGLRSLKGSGIQAAYMYTSATPAAGNPNPAAGYALIQLANNYNRYVGGFTGCVSPTTGGTIAINSTSLTAGSPYIIASVGHGAKGATTIAPTGADSSGSLAGTYFNLYDSYGNVFTLYFYVTGVGGGAPAGAPNPYQVTIAEGASADAQTTALSGVIALLPSGISGVYSFTCSGGGGATLTVTSTANAPLAGPAGCTPAAIAASLNYPATYALTVYNTNLENWQAVGLPPGIVPAVGASFIATSTGQSTHGGSTGLVIAPGVSGITCVEVIGDPNQSIAPIPMGGSPNTGAWILVQFLAPTVSTGAYVSPMVPTAPANGTVVGMTFYMEAGSILIAGE